MTDLHLALLGLGAVLVAGVLAFNAVQERRARARAEKAFGSDHADVLLGAGPGGGARREPTLGALPAEAAASASSDLFEPILAPGERASGAATDALVEPSPGPDAVLSAKVDTIATILADTPLGAATLAPLLEALQSSQPRFAVEGLADGLWRPVEGDADGAWRELRVGLQLASRSGPVSEADIGAFQETVANFCSGVNAVSQRESAAEAAARAAELDRFCADADIEVVVNVVGQFGATFALGRVKAIALEHGLSETAEGLVRFTSASQALFSVRRHDRPGARQDTSYVSGLTMALDLPHVADPVAAFAQMVGLAEVLCRELGGELVDDNRKALTANGIAAIGRQVADVAAAMQAFGVPAGSALARRLFA